MKLDLLNNVREILLSDWDPLGVGENQNLSDEYDSVAYKIISLLVSSAGEEKILEYLSGSEEALHAFTSEEAKSFAAKNLWALRHLS